MTILIADDERTIREGLVNSIDWRSLGIDTVLQASDGREARDIIDKDAPDIAILDIIMPEMTGIELVSAYRNNAGAPKFILLSGYSEFDYAREALRSNVVDYLLKPCDVEEISGVISSVAAKIREAREEQNEFLSSLEALDAGARLRIIRSYLTDGAFPTPEDMSGAQKGEGLSAPVRKALEYIQENLSNPNLSMNMVARDILYLHPDYFGKMFKKEVGDRFSNVLMSMRMAEAMRLLGQQGERMKVYEVAAAVGLGDNVAYFSQAFRKMSGVLPTRYAKSKE